MDGRGEIVRHPKKQMQKTVVFGKHPVKELLRAGRRKVETILYVHQNSQRLEDVLKLAKSKNIPIQSAGAKQLDQRSDGANHQGILAVTRPPATHSLDSFIKLTKEKSASPVIVVLDSIQDPHNFGAILRSAETFGISSAIFPKNRSCDINSTVVKTSAGASEYIDFHVATNISNTLSRLKEEGFYVIAAEAEGDTPLAEFKPEFPLAVVLGSEEKGVRPLVKKQCDSVIRIPMRGRVASLNVSTAAAVIFYEISRSF
ncbi:MAG: 23S rRNA (guanosine(2251)-2'-O)-methyltransferase RlmB [Nitrospinota bacterium]